MSMNTFYYIFLNQRKNPVYGFKNHENPSRNKVSANVLKKYKNSEYLKKVKKTCSAKTNQKSNL